MRYKKAHNELVVVKTRRQDKPYAFAANMPSKHGFALRVLHSLSFGEDRLAKVLTRSNPAMQIDPWQDDRRQVCRDLATPGRKYIIRRYVICGWDENGPEWQYTGPMLKTDDAALGRRIVEKLNATTGKYVKFHMEHTGKRRHF